MPTRIHFGLLKWLLFNDYGSGSNVLIPIAGEPKFAEPRQLDTFTREIERAAKRLKFWVSYLQFLLHSHFNGAL